MKSVSKSSKQKHLLAVLSAFAILITCPMQVQAQEKPAVSIRAGGADHYHRVELAWESPSLWSHRFTGNGSRLDLVAELGAAYWHASGRDSPANLWQFSAIPMLRWSFGNGYYLEAGAGPTLISRTRFANKTLSTAFQFGDHIGGGVYLSGNSRIGLRFSHFSNADIKRPNAGLNALQLLYSYQY
ncbi:acyloxyacyl hydrolase [Allopusillimonas ginsengisoli]|nr:acyloxyacyl hydrolase [Allopusillimonas ginsengisoli]